MRSTQFPTRIDPYKFAEQRKIIEATLTVDYFERFRQELNSSKGEIRCEINGFKNEVARQSSLKVELSGQVELVCHGCLKPYMQKIERQATLYPVHSEEKMKSMPDDLEAVLVGEDGLDIKSAIEDELILTLPLVPLYGECEELESYQVGELPEEVIKADKEKKNPFDALKNLKFDD